MPLEYRPVLSTYMDTLREIELLVERAERGARAVARRNHRPRRKTSATTRRATSSATMMYGPRSSDLHCAEVLGGGVVHHSCAHNQRQGPLVDRLRGMNQVHVGLLADLLSQLRDLNLIDSTLVMYGSDMSDGDLHNTENLPVLLCGAGADLRFGQVVSDRTVRQPLSNLHLEILHLLGVSTIAEWGEGELLSTGQTLPIRT